MTWLRLLAWVAMAVGLTAAVVLAGASCVLLEHALRPLVGINWSNVLTLLAVMLIGTATALCIHHAHP